VEQRTPERAPDDRVVVTSEVFVASGTRAGFLLALGHKSLSITVVGR
jgi:hypothetical protein